MWRGRGRGKRRGGVGENCERIKGRIDARLEGS